MSHRDATGKFPEFPDVDEGGSLAIFKQREEGGVSLTRRDGAYPACGSVRTVIVTCTAELNVRTVWWF